MNISVVNDSRPILHIAFGVDANYFMGMGVAIVSIMENNRCYTLIFHVFIPSISPDQASKLREIESKYQTVIEVNIIDHSIFDEFADFSAFTQYSPAIFTRLLIADALNGITGKVLYLDADIICQGDFAGLLSIDMDES
ncbi:MAG: glycosyltransferase, partial [Glaciimonas sp.]|nr:glycosyltransferase [Glaciimonas sp.]